MNLADAPHVLTIEEAAKALRIGRTAAYEAARRGDLPGAVRIGRTWRVSRHQLEQLLGVPINDDATVRNSHFEQDREDAA
jgi:excisionase family DNA binding protein